MSLEYTYAAPFFPTYELADCNRRVCIATADDRISPELQELDVTASGCVDDQATISISGKGQPYISAFGAGVPIARSIRASALHTLFSLIISVLSIIPSHAEQGSADTRDSSQGRTKIDVERELRDEYEQMNASFTDYYLTLKGNETKEEVMQYIVDHLPEHFVAIMNADSCSFAAKDKK